MDRLEFMARRETPESRAREEDGVSQGAINQGSYIVDLGRRAEGQLRVVMM